MKNHEDWNGVLAQELEELRVRLLQRELRQVAVGGSMRHPCWFAVGHELSEVAGFNVAAACRDFLWEEPADCGPPPPVTVRHNEVTGTGGEEVALVVEISSEGFAAVRDAFATREQVGQVLAVTVDGGPHRRLFSAGSGAEVMASAYGVREWVRQNLRRTPHVHLVIVGPAAFALFLGHLWDRVPATTIYEDLLDGYEPAFTFAGS